MKNFVGSRKWKRDVIFNIVISNDVRTNYYKSINYDIFEIEN